MSDYQPPLPFFGTPFVPQPAPLAPPFIQSPRNSPGAYSWRNYSSPLRNTIANNVGIGIVGPQPLVPPQQGGANAQPYHQGGPSESAILKTILSFRLAHPDSEVVGYHKEIGGNGKVRVTVTFETSGEM